MKNTKGKKNKKKEGLKKEEQFKKTSAEKSSRLQIRKSGCKQKNKLENYKELYIKNLWIVIYNPKYFYFKCYFERTAVFELSLLF